MVQLPGTDLVYEVHHAVLLVRTAVCTKWIKANIHIASV